MKPRPLLDLNVLFDVLMKRMPHYTASAEVWMLAERGEINALVCADSFTTLYYLLRRDFGHAKSIRYLSMTQKIFEITPVDQACIQTATASSMNDFEDAVQYFSAMQAKATEIITRDPKGFKAPQIPILSPEEFLVGLKQE